ncbi:hypothetical protein [Actinophytocola sp.]|uniref:hypothetical protein n=1 Tax=Actinophytocola sp. TaxID=1872138 RepID=UPI002ED022AE
MNQWVHASLAAESPDAMDAFRRLAARAGAALACGAVPDLPDVAPDVRGEVYLRAVTAFVASARPRWRSPG